MSDEQSNPLALIMKGGGVKGLAYVGALEELEQKYKFNWYVGTSAGAIAAVLLGAGFTPSELGDILREKDFRTFFDAGRLRAAFNMLTQRGFYEANTLTDWLDTLLAKRLKSPDRVKLSDLRHRVTIYASRREADFLKFDSETNDAYAAFAARCSMSYPFVFVPQSDQGYRTYDGGMRNNYPVEALLRDHSDAQFISLFLGTETYVPIQNKSIVSDLLAIWVEASDMDLVQKYSDRTVIIDTQPINTLDFGLTTIEKEYLVACGRAGALAHLVPNSVQYQDAVQHRNELKSTVEEKREDARQARVEARTKLRRRWILGAIIMMVVAAGYRLWQAIPNTATLDFPAFSKAYEAIQRNPTELAKFKDVHVNTRATWTAVVLGVHDIPNIPYLIVGPNIEDAHKHPLRATFNEQDFVNVQALRQGDKIEIQGYISEATNPVGPHLRDCKLIRQIE